MNRKDVALIGVGGHGRWNLRQFRLFEERGWVRIRAVADPFRSQMPEAEAELKAAGVRWYEDYRELLACEKGLGVVCISTPIALHYEMVRDALRATDAWVLVEKPAVPAIQQLRELIALDSNERVRVGFQSVHSRFVQTLKGWITCGALGRVRRVITSSAWPRDDAYYQRAPWAGRMMLGGRLVFDGPMTNALAHSLHNALYLTAPGERVFGEPSSVSAVFGRAREMEGHDFVWLRAQVGEAELHLAYAHCVSACVPFTLRVEGERGAAWICDHGETLGNDVGLPVPTKSDEEDKDAIYYSLLREEVAPTRLRDVLAYTTLTNAAYLSAGGVVEIPGVYSAEGCMVGPGVEEYIAAFARNCLPPHKAGLEWACPGREVDARAITHFAPVLNEPRLV